MVQPRRPHIREILTPTDPAIGQAHRLLRRTFHKAELVPVAEWRESLRERVADLWTDIRWHLVVAELHGKVVGIVSGTYLGNVNTGVIGYLAVSTSARGFGLGPRLRASLHTRFARSAEQLSGKPLEAVIGEVRPDNPWLRTLVRRDGVLALAFPYFQPDLHEDEDEVPLVLYYESLRRPRRRLPTVLLRQLLFTVWRRVYRIPRPLSHRPFRRMLESLEGKVSVGKLTPADLPTLNVRLAR